MKQQQEPNGHDDLDDAMEPPTPQDLLYRDDQHHDSTLQALNTMRKNKRFCDVILHVGTAEIEAHRAVLASVSPHLFELFSADQDCGRDNEPLPSYRLNGGLDKHALQILVDYAYTATLEVPDNQVKSVYLAAWQLRMDRVVGECARHLVSRLTAESCIETRSLPGIARNKLFVSQVDEFISEKFSSVSKTSHFLALACVQLEVLHQTRQEMSMVSPGSLCRLALDWVKRQQQDDSITVTQLLERSHLLYLAMDNSLQDCTHLPAGDQESDIVHDYKKLALKCPNKGRRKGLGQPVRPRVLIYSRDIGERIDDSEPDWTVIGSDKVGDHTFLALVTMDGAVARLSIQLRLNTPTSPSPVTTPIATRPPSEEIPDLYCELASMGGGKCAFGVAALGNGMVVCGGYDRVECLRSVEFYSPEENTWTTLPSMREARGRVQIAVLDMKVYAMGGSNGTTELDTMEVLEPGAAKWSRAPCLPLARSNSAVCEHNGLIYCIGGWNGQVGIRQCDQYDPKTNKWSSIQPLITGRYQSGVIPYNNYLYAVGGCDAWNCLASVERYDTVECAWSPASYLMTPRRGCGVAVFQGKLYAVGGSDGTHSLSTTEVYDQEIKCWVSGPSLTVPRANVGLVVVGERLYAVGGFTGKMFLNTIEYLDTNLNEWTTFVPKQSPQLIEFNIPTTKDKEHIQNVCKVNGLNLNGKHIESRLNEINDNTHTVVSDKEYHSTDIKECNGGTNGDIEVS